MSVSSYGSHGARSRASSHGSTRQKARSTRMIRLCSVLLLFLIMYIKLFSSSDSNASPDNNTTARRFKLQKKAKGIDTRPEFGPINNSLVQAENDPDKLPQNRHPDHDAMTNTDRYSYNDGERVHESYQRKENSNVPQALENIANVESGPFQKGIDIPFYWHIPRSGGGTMSDVLGR